MADVNVQNTPPAGGDGGGSGAVVAIVLIVVLLILGWVLYSRGTFGGSSTKKVDINVNAPAAGTGGTSR